MININLIWAQSQNGVIGHHGAMPWHIPEDLAHFREITLNHPVIMGRKTWDSLPARFRPLPKRRNIVLTRQKNWGNEFNNNQVIKANSIDAAMTPQILGTGVKEAWVIGGGQIYLQFLPHAYRIEITEIQDHFEGDTQAPKLGSQWKELKRTKMSNQSGLKFDFVSYINQEKLGQASLIF